MPYTAAVVSKQIKQGQLHVVLEYYNAHGEGILRDEMVSRSNQDDNWIMNEVMRRIKDLEGVDILYNRIVTGTVKIPAPEKKVVTLYDKYAQDLNNFSRYLAALRQGIIPIDRTEFVALREKLKTNFRPEYLELFMGL